MNTEHLPLVSQISAAYFSNHQVAPNHIANVIKKIHDGIVGLDSPAPAAALKPAVPIKKSVTNEAIFCLEDGKRLKMLKRYLRSNYDLTPEQYRARWGLPADYPMVAPNYAAQRSAFAKKIGLGKVAHPRRRTGTRS